MANSNGRRGRRGIGEFLLPDRGRAFRPDLEGIRGIALMVILFTHLIEWPSGGFVALDLFFVLSGFLITGLLVREFDRTGTISLSTFYRRRLRRLTPAATLVIAITLAAAFVVFPLTRAVSIAWDGIWATLVVANWNFALNGTDYFATWLPQSPLLHYWSLSLEEQFYLVWPALVLGFLALGARRSRAKSEAAAARGETGVPSRRPLVIAIAVISAASFAWGVIQPMTSPEVSYLSTLTRTWELGAGALLFFAAPLWQRIPAFARPVLAWVGFAGIIVLSFVYTPSLPLPGMYLLAPVAATALIIVSGVGGANHLWIATNPVAAYLGRISYSAYLWHWPIFIFTGAIVGATSPIYLFGSIPLSLLIAALTFHTIEDPIRTSSWLERGRPRISSGERRRRRARFAQRGVAVLGAAAVVMVALAVATPRDGAQASGRYAMSVPSAEPATDGAAAPADVASETVESAVLAALDADSWPGSLDGAIQTLGQQGGPDDITRNECLDVSEANLEQCSFGPADLTRTAVLVGDSVAVSWLPGLTPAVNALGYRLQVLTRHQCPFADVSVSGSFTPGTVAAGYPDDCNAHREWTQTQIAASSPDLVIVSDGEAEMQMLLTPDGESGSEYWEAGLTRSIDRATAGSDTRRVAVLGSPPQADSITECYTRFSAPGDCMSRIDDQWKTQDSATSAAIESAAAGERVGLVDTRAWFCSDQQWCPAFAGDTIIRADRQHLNGPYAATLSAVLKTGLEPFTTP